MAGYYVQRTNLSADGEVTIIGKRFTCGDTAEPYVTKSSAERALKAQKKQDDELCPECAITYQIVWA